LRKGENVLALRKVIAALLMNATVFLLLLHSSHAVLMEVVHVVVAAKK